MRVSLATRRALQHVRTRSAAVSARAPIVASAVSRWQLPSDLAGCIGTEAAFGRQQQRRCFAAQGAEESKPANKADGAEETVSSQEASSESASSSSSDSGGGGGGGDKGGAGVDASSSEKGAAKEKSGTQAAATAPVGEEPPAEKEESPLELMEKELAEAEDKMKKEKHELLLALADFENNKKRYMREREARKRVATVNFATKMVEVYSKYDELAHAEDNIEKLSDSCKALQEG